MEWHCHRMENGLDYRPDNLAPRSQRFVGSPPSKRENTSPSKREFTSPSIKKDDTPSIKIQKENNLCVSE